jgi:hypothetical protein
VVASSGRDAPVEMFIKLFTYVLVGGLLVAVFYGLKGRKSE